MRKNIFFIVFIILLQFRVQKKNQILLIRFI